MVEVEVAEEEVEEVVLEGPMTLQPNAQRYPGLSPLLTITLSASVRGEG